MNYRTVGYMSECFWMKTSHSGGVKCQHVGVSAEALQTGLGHTWLGHTWKAMITLFLWSEDSENQSCHGVFRCQTLQNCPGLCSYFWHFWLYGPVSGTLCAIGIEGERFRGSSCLLCGCVGSDVSWRLGDVVQWQHWGNGNTKGSGRNRQCRGPFGPQPQQENIHTPCQQRALTFWMWCA